MPSKQPKPVLRGSSHGEYISIRNFMCAEGGMGLSGVRAMVYALIYSHSPADALENSTGCYYGSIEYTAARIGAGRSTTIDALKWLVKEGLIVEKGEHRQGDSSTTKRYVADQERALAAQRRFQEYWDARNPRDAETPSGPETVPGRPPAENGVFSRPETGPGHSAPRPETVPENPQESGSGSPRPETGRGEQSARPETEPGHVQKSDPIKRGYIPLGLSSTHNPSPSPTPSEPEAAPKAAGKGRAMDGAEVAREIGSDLEPEYLSAVKGLMKRSINQRAKIAEVIPAYREALENGYTPEQIDRGYTAYVARYRKKHPGDPSFAMRLSNYLVRGDGLPTDEPKPEQGPKAKAAAKRALMQKLSDAQDPMFMSLYDAVPTDEEVALGFATEGEQTIAKARLNDYLAYHQGKKGTAYERRIRSLLGHGGGEGGAA